MKEEIYIQEAIRNLKDLVMQKDKIDNQIKECEKILKEYMTYYNIEEMYGENGEKVIYKEIIRNRFDTKEFKKQFEPLYNSFLRVTKNQRFNFSY